MQASYGFGFDVDANAFLAAELNFSQLRPTSPLGRGAFF
jgi:hypothetical protein